LTRALRQSGPGQVPSQQSRFSVACKRCPHFSLIFGDARLVLVLSWEAYKPIMRISDVLFRLISARDPNCPDEGIVLAYAENRLSPRRRSQIERHFADCHDCREILAFLGREVDRLPASLAAEAVSEQTNRVLAYIQTDERNRSRSTQRTKTSAGFYLSYPRLAAVGLVICAMLAGAIYVIIRSQSPTEDAMVALKQGFKETRYTEARISGGFGYSPYAGTIRGADSNRDNLHLDRAENKIKAAAQEPDAVEARLIQARVLLARGDLESAKHALAILDQLTRSGIDTPPAFNDTGVAHLRLSNYPEAITYFNKALEKSPAYNEALFNRALAEQLDGRYEDARRDWQVFIEKSSDENWNNEARERLNRLNGMIN
jgi:tetratricopeptide (TPR) repeat protein